MKNKSIQFSVIFTIVLTVSNLNSHYSIVTKAIIFATGITLSTFLALSEKHNQQLFDYIKTAGFMTISMLTGLATYHLLNYIKNYIASLF